MPNIPLLPKQPEPVAWRFDEEVAKGVAVTVYKSVANSWIARGYKATPLFELATTQPVIPEQLTVRMAEEKALSLGAVLYDEEADVFADGWNACRAEMLKAQQNEPQNIPENIPAQPVIPEQRPMVPDEIIPDQDNTYEYVDGWNACRSEMLKAQPVSEPYKLKDAVADIRNSGVEIDADKINAERDTLNSPVIPDGWKLVPVEPTAAMFHAFNDCDYGRKSMRERYIQMIEAAPARECENG